jgi:hypothetical protein
MSDPAGSPLTTKSRVLETAAGAIQDFRPVKQICAYLNAFHVYASDPTRAVEAHHYCSHITEGLSCPFFFFFFLSTRGRVDFL